MRSRRVHRIRLLIRGPNDHAGALGFGLDVSPPEPQSLFGQTLDLAGVQKAAGTVIEGRNDHAGPVRDQLEKLLLLGTSMGGARPKAVVENRDDLCVAEFG